APRRRVDTRGNDPIGPGRRLCFEVEGSPGDVVVVNLTPVRATGVGHGLLVGGDASDPAEASNVNYAPGTVDPNLALAPIGTAGDVCFANADQAAVHLVADHLATIDAAAIDLAGPTRALDTRE